MAWYTSIKGDVEKVEPGFEFFVTDDIEEAKEYGYVYEVKGVKESDISDNQVTWDEHIEFVIVQPEEAETNADKEEGETNESNFSKIADMLREGDRPVKMKKCSCGNKTAAHGACDSCGKYHHALDSKKKPLKGGKNFDIKNLK